MTTQTRPFHTILFFSIALFVFQSCCDHSQCCANCSEKNAEIPIPPIQPLISIPADVGCPGVTGLLTEANLTNPNPEISLKNAVVTWDAVANASSYYVELHDKTLVPPTLVNSWNTPNNTLEIEDLNQSKVDNSHYYYHITTICDSIHSIIVTDDLVKL